MAMRIVAHPAAAANCHWHWQWPLARHGGAKSKAEMKRAAGGAGCARVFAIATESVTPGIFCALNQSLAPEIFC
jgi:hypothetical protein